MNTSANALASRPLAGITVVDMATVLMGPLATQVMGDYGANIIKVEPPEGDVMRHAGASRHALMGSMYLSTGRNKRSLVLDIKQADGKAALLKLCETADVFIHNVRPAAMSRAGLSYDDLFAVNPKIIYVALIGFGEFGPYSGKPAFDDIMQGAAGVAGLFLRAGHEAPQFIPWNVADRITGITAVHATLAALLMRGRTGEGQAIDVPMFETVAQMVLGDHIGGLAFDPPQGPSGYNRLLAATRQPYKTLDGYIVATPYNDKQFRSLLGAIGRAQEILANPIMTSQAARARHWPEVYVVLAEIFATRTTAQWLEICAEHEVPCTPVRTLEELVADPHLAEVGFFQMREHPTEGRIREMRPSTRWSTADVSLRLHAPLVGEHSLEILQEAGYSAQALQAMLASGATVDGRPGVLTASQRDIAGEM